MVQAQKKTKTKDKKRGKALDLIDNEKYIMNVLQRCSVLVGQSAEIFWPGYFCSPKIKTEMKHTLSHKEHAQLSTTIAHQE